MVGTIGILAGEGVLPARVAESAYAAGHQVYILGFEGFAEASVIESWPHDYVRLGAAGQILTLLRRHGCTDLVLIGPVRRPSLSSLRPDIEGARILTRLGCALFSGDDGLLAALVRILGEEGFRVRGAHEFLQHSMVTPG
ncbi:MAG: LpxI family protein, partial [Acetobacter sp.]|nr:LpxI family protein [Acetobacter sp.]